MVKIKGLPLAINVRKEKLWFHYSYSKNLNFWLLSVFICETLKRDGGEGKILVWGVESTQYKFVFTSRAPLRSNASCFYLHIHHPTSPPES